MSNLDIDSFLMGFSIATVLFVAYNLVDFISFWSQGDHHDEN